MKKTLLEQLREWDKDKIVAIAADKGSNWVYIGPAGNEELITRCFNDLLHESEARLAKAMDKIKFLVSNPGVLKIENTETAEGLDKITLYSHDVNHTCKSIAKNTKFINTYIEPLNRKVTEIYPKEVDSCTAVIVTGLETGKFWTREEFEKKYGK